MVVLVFDSSPFEFTVVLLSVLLEAAGDSFTTVVLFSVLFSPGGLTVVFSLFSHAANKATPANRMMYFFIKSGVDRATYVYGVAVAVAAGDSVVAAGDSVVVVVVVSVEVVALGLAAGATVSVFCSQAASNAAPARMQIYLFIVVI